MQSPEFRDVACCTDRPFKGIAFSSGIGRKKEPVKLIVRSPIRDHPIQNEWLLLLGHARGQAILGPCRLCFGGVGPDRADGWARILGV